MYISVLSEIGGEKFNECNFQSQRLSDKLKLSYGDKIIIDSGNIKRGNIVYSSETAAEDAIRYVCDSKDEIKMRDVAFRLRKSILAELRTPLPEDVTLEHVLKGEIEIPDDLALFLTYLISGPDSRRGETESRSRRIKSIAQDLIFSVTGGVAKPAKHLILGLALKKLTSSRKLIDILNALGCISNCHLLEALETELTMQQAIAGNHTPHDMKLLPLPSGLAFDNYDRYVETLSGKHTLHDTVGIMYQNVHTIGNQQTDNQGASWQVDFGAIRKTSSNKENVAFEVSTADGPVSRTAKVRCPVPLVPAPGPSSESSASSESSPALTRSLGKNRRRKFEPSVQHIEPYRKKPKLRNILHHNSQALKQVYMNVPSSYHLARIKDLLWVISLHLTAQKTPMWAGWNSYLETSLQTMQKISYLAQIPE